MISESKLTSLTGRELQAKIESEYEHAIAGNPAVRRVFGRGL
jgi:hypothetical protein